MIKFSQIKGVGLALQISFHPPLERFDGLYNEHSFRPTCQVCM